MSNLGFGLQLMLIGMLTVFVILLIVIFGSRLLIAIINRIAPAEQAPAKASSGGASAGSRCCTYRRQGTYSQGN